MKNKKISICSKCDFQANEKLKICPLCNNIIFHQEGEEININPTLPETLINDSQRPVQLVYYCYKCHCRSHKKVCLQCNVVGYLALEAFGKRVFINHIINLKEEFKQDEVEKIAQMLTLQEKYYLYHHFADAHRYFYRHDKNKAVACFFFALIFFFFFFDLAYSMKEKEILPASFFFLCLGTTFLGSLAVLGIWYLVDASQIEFKKIPKKIFLCVSLMQLIAMLYGYLKLTTLKMMLIFSGGALIISLVSYVIMLIRGEKENEK